MARKKSAVVPCAEPMTSVAMARASIADAFKRDPHFRQTYVDNAIDIIKRCDLSFRDVKTRRLTAASCIVAAFFED